MNKKEIENAADEYTNKACDLSSKGEKNDAKYDFIKGAEWVLGQLKQPPESTNPSTSLQEKTASNIVNGTHIKITVPSFGEHEAIGASLKDIKGFTPNRPIDKNAPLGTVNNPYGWFSKEAVAKRKEKKDEWNESVKYCKMMGIGYIPSVEQPFDPNGIYYCTLNKEERKRLNNGTREELQLGNLCLHTSTYSEDIPSSVEYISDVIEALLPFESISVNGDGSRWNIIVRNSKDNIFKITYTGSKEKCTDILNKAKKSLDN